MGKKLGGRGGEGKGGKVYVPLNFYNSVSPQVCTKHEVSPVNTGTKRQHPDSNGSDNSTVDMVCWCTLTSPSDLHRGGGKLLSEPSFPFCSDVQSLFIFVLNNKGIHLILCSDVCA